MKFFWERKLLVSFSTLVMLYLIINLATLFLPHTYSKEIFNIPKVGTILVVAAHQDDETIIAGGGMIQTLKKGGKVYVIYTVDGTTRKPYTTEKEVQKNIMLREKEASKSLNSIGIPFENIFFLRNENALGLRNISNIELNIQKIFTYIKEINPDMIFISAYEGGNCDHDMTNYMVVKAAEKANFSKNLILESPEYNRYYLLESVLKRLNKLLIIKCPMPPRFIPSNSRTFTLNMTSGELQKKLHMFIFFESQNPDDLIDRFGYPDQYRYLIDYNYSASPFDPNSSIRYRICLLIKGGSKSCSPFYCGMTFDDYKNIYQLLKIHEYENKNI